MSLEEKVRTELLALRKTRDGVTVAALAQRPVICGLLANGDPALTYSRLQHTILDSDLGLSIKAAAYSLGLLSEERSHLGRLDAFGAEHGYDQRHARRYSDRGVRELAQLIATNLAVTSVPCLDVVIVQSSDARVDVALSTKWLWFVDMQPAIVTIRRGDEPPEPIELRWVGKTDETHRIEHTKPVVIAVTAETSIVIVWRGELWPKFGVTWAEGRRDAQSAVETLGNKLAIRFWPDS
ncbi:hypothetical protein [Kribbella solani]|uniref:hypothetical protein n=1 Tax=Kribbella solani TaxID=236067 RepID=UPI0029B5E68D|nr:hypothetical protein [Kribbella solani]MDX2974387.1 hypothetical protein [Kribbella solani]